MCQSSLRYFHCTGVAQSFRNVMVVVIVDMAAVVISGTGRPELAVVCGADQSDI